MTTTTNDEFSFVFDIASELRNEFVFRVLSLLYSSRILKQDNAKLTEEMLNAKYLTLVGGHNNMISGYNFECSDVMLPNSVFFDYNFVDMLSSYGYIECGARHLLRIYNDLIYKKPDTNPKQALGLSNIPMTMLSPLANMYGSIGKLNGALKYGTSNFIGTEVIMSIYLDAIKRHISAIEAGEEFDPFDGVPHYSAILANVDILLCSRAAGTLIDDRPLLKGYREEMEKLKPIVNSLKELHKDKNPHHYYLKDSV